MNEIERLSPLVRKDPGSPAFAALAEAHRRRGQVDDAIRVAREGLRRAPGRIAGRVALGRALLDHGLHADAELEFERVRDAVPDHPLAYVPPAERTTDLLAPQDALDELAEVNDTELDRAFAQAETEHDSVLDASHVAQEAILEHDLGEPEIGDPDSPFATETMAGLLESQGHAGSAEAIRGALASRETISPLSLEAPPDSPRTRVISTLERWLRNLRRGELR